LVKKLVIKTMEACPDNPISLNSGATQPAITSRIPKTLSRKTPNETGIVSFNNQTAVLVPCGSEVLTHFKSRNCIFSVFEFSILKIKKAAHYKLLNIFMHE
jgi:hypothetical protein